MSDVGGIAVDRLRSFIERIERLEEEVAELNGDKAEVYSEAKGTGFDVKAMKAVIAERRKMGKDKAGYAEHRVIVDLYRDALGMGE